MRKRAVSFVLCLCMALSLLLLPVLAVGKHPFTDVAATDWFNDSVQYVYENGMMNGTTATTFSPNDMTSRGMIVAILYRLEQSPTVVRLCPFRDVASGQYYERAVTWAVFNNIITGYDSFTFKPDEPIKRQQIIAILYRYARHKGYDLSATGNLAKYSDINAIDDYARVPMTWAEGNQLMIDGMDGNHLHPLEFLSRKYTAAILTRFCQNIVFKGQQTQKAYNITFDLNYEGGGIYQTVQVGEGEKIPQPKNPTRNNYSFLGWFLEEAGTTKLDFRGLVTANRTVYAKWGKKSSSSSRSSSGGSANSGRVNQYPATYSVSFDSSGGTYVPSQVVVANTPVTEPLPAPTKAGFIFKGWFLDETSEEPYNFSNPVNNNISLVAKWNSGIVHHVTFYTDSETVFLSEAVPDGKQAREPDNPQKEGYHFDGWFTTLTGQTGKTKYNFSEGVTGSISLYAKWSVPDKLNIEFSTSITAEDFSYLYANQTSVVANSETEITFCVNSTLTVPYFNLLLDGQYCGVQLYDDGESAIHGDDIPNDGYYTGKYVMRTDEERNFIFTANAQVGESVAATDALAIFSYIPFSEEQINEMDAVSSRISQLIDEVKVSNTGLSEEENAHQKYVAVLQYLLHLSEDGHIDNLAFDEEYYSIAYSMYGSNHFISFSDTPSYYGKSDDESGNALLPLTFSGNSERRASERVLSDSLASHDYVDLLSLNIDADYLTYNERAIILSSEPFSEKETTFMAIAESVEGLLRNAGFDVTVKFSATVEDFKNLSDYDFIYVLCHGYLARGEEFDDHWHAFSAIPTIVAEVVTTENQNQYAEDKDSILQVYWEEDNSHRYAISPDFFKTYYVRNTLYRWPLEAKLVSIASCEAGHNSKLADALLEAGADAVTAYSDTVFQNYEQDMIPVVIENLLNGSSVLESVNEAKSRLGRDEKEWFEGAWFDQRLSDWFARDANDQNLIKREEKDGKIKWLSKDDIKDEFKKNLSDHNASLNIYGNSSIEIHSSLQNGLFSPIFGGLLGGLYGWRVYGDARAIFKLSGIAPMDGTHMAILSTGFGSMNDETTSAIFQTVLIPGDANKITFRYDYISEEPMEYVGSEFNDIFQADILNVNGDVIETLAYESINDSEWIAVDGIDFPGGDETMYHTRWKTVSFDLNETHKGHLLVIRFAVQDAGDSDFDTAVLIDSIRIH